MRLRSATIGTLALVAVGSGSVTTVAQAPSGARVLVMPFTVSVDAKAAGGAGASLWLGEAARLLLLEDFERLGVTTVTRDESTAAFDRLQLPVSAALTRATMIRVGELVGASEVVFGDVRLGDQLTVRARMLRLGTSSAAPEVVARRRAHGHHSAVRAHGVGARHRHRAPIGDAGEDRAADAVPGLRELRERSRLADAQRAAALLRGRDEAGAARSAPAAGAVGRLHRAGPAREGAVGGERRLQGLAAVAQGQIPRGVVVDRARAIRRRVRGTHGAQSRAALAGALERARDRAASAAATGRLPRRRSSTARSTPSRRTPTISSISAMRTRSRRTRPARSTGCAKPCASTPPTATRIW